MKRYVPLLCTVLLLSGCGTPAPTEEVAKQPFFIETITAQSLTQRPELLKTGKITAGQEIVISSQVAGRVSQITTKLGEEVSAEQQLVKLDDTNGAYTFAVKRAWTALQQAQISYEATLLGVDKSLSDSQLALRQAQTQRDSTSTSRGDSATQLQLDQIDAELSKANFDYSTKLQADEQTIANYFTTVRNLTEDVRLLRENILTDTDKILGITDLYKYTNDSYESLLGARNTSTFRDAKESFRRAQQLTIPALNTQDSDALEGHIHNLMSALDPLSDLVADMKVMLEYTETSNQFSSSTLLGMQANMDGLQNAVQGQYSLLNSQTNSIASFLATYAQQQDSLLQSIAIAEQQRDLLARNLQDAETRAQLGLEGAENTATTSQKSKQTTIASLQNSIAQASVGYQEAQHQISKLQIAAPISGVVTDVLVDVGQEVSPGTPLIAMSNNEHPEIRISLTEDELLYITLGKTVKVSAQGEVWSGTIVSYAKTSDVALHYEVVISLDEPVELLGELVEVAIPFETTTPLLPLNSITLINDAKGLITLQQGTGLTQQVVEVGKLRGDMIEVTSTLDPKWIIVISDAGTFDPARFDLKTE